MLNNITEVLGAAVVANDSRDERVAVKVVLRWMCTRLDTWALNTGTQKSQTGQRAQMLVFAPIPPVRDDKQTLTSLCHLLQNVLADDTGIVVGVRGTDFSCTLN